MGSSLRQRNILSSLTSAKMSYTIRWLAPLVLCLSFRQAPLPLIKPQRLTAAQVPPGLKLPGKLLEAWRWQDAQGENVLLITRTPVRPEAKPKALDEEWHTELYARQYIRQAAGYQELWRLYDTNRYCWGDMELGPLSGATTITDLDTDGVSETTLVYKISCRTDVSPAEMKLIMHEGQKKYALRGSMIQLANYPTQAEKQKQLNKPLCCISKVPALTPNQYYPREGLYESEKEFAAAPPAFLAFARQQWRRWRTHDLFEPLN